MSKERVVTIGPAYPYRGGQTIVEASIYGKLSEAGYDCHTVSFSLLYPKIFFPGTTQYDKSKNLFNPHLEKTYRLINSINPFSWYKAYKKIKQLQPKTVIFIWWMPFFGPCYIFLAKLIKRNTNSKIIFLIENFISHEKRWFDMLFTKRTLKYADSFITHSKHIQKEVKAVFPNKKIEYTSLPSFDFFNQNRFTKEESKKMLGIHTDRVILFFGLIRHYKGLDQLIRAMNTLMQEDKNISLLIVGECYEDISTYEKLIEENGIQERTTLINKFIDNEDVEPYFKAADMVCLPYYHGTQSGILMMAYGFRKAVIATDVGGVAELISSGQTGQVIEDNEPQKIVMAIKKTYKQMEHTDFSKNIDDLASTLGYKSFVQLFEEVKD